MVDMVDEEDEDVETGKVKNYERACSSSGRAHEQTRKPEKTEQPQPEQPAAPFPAPPPHLPAPGAPSYNPYQELRS